MAVFASDAFGSGSGDLVGTAPDVGGNWTDGSSGGSPSPVYVSNNIRQEDAATAITYVDTAAPSADYYVQALLTPNPGGCGGIAGVVGRKVAGSGSGNHTCYVADYYDHATAGSRVWRLYKYVAGTYTGLGTNYTQNIGTTPTTVKLEMIGTAIKVYVNGVERISATDSSITAAGYAGVTFGAAVGPTLNHILLDDFVADSNATTQTVSVGTASETDTAGAVVPTSPDQTITVGTAEEADTAPALVAIFDQTISVGTASETDTAGATPLGSISGTRAQGGMALLFRSGTAPASQTITVGTATETDTAFSVTIPADQTITVGTAVETDTALAISVAEAQTISVGTAVETDTAAAVTLVLPGTIVVHPQGMVPGTSIGAYLRWEWKGPVAAKLNAGPGSAVETTTVADDLTATFTLPAGEYVAYASAYPTKRLFFMVTE